MGTTEKIGCLWGILCDGSNADTDGELDCLAGDFKQMIFNRLAD